MYLINNSKDNCYGCSACVSICPTQCISMLSDNEGFYYPNIDLDKCIKCNACIKVCPYDKETNKLLDTLKNRNIYGAKHKNKEVRLNSSSGGVFSEIGNYIIGNNGVVYGAVFNNNNLKVEHIRAVNFDNLYRMRGSKYVQSNLNNTFQQVENDLKNRLFVGYSGTPCQVAGLLEFLQKDYENLITIDFICHGVPSPRVFSDYLSFISNGEKINLVEFRDKTISWGVASMKIQYEKAKTYIKKWTRDPYYALFFKDLILRPSCHTCKYSTVPRTSDITMGDFWGVEKNHDNFKDDVGVSYLIINTVKGQQTFDYIKNEYDYINAKLEDARQPNLQSPTPKPSNRDIFWKDYDELKFISVLKKYADYGVSNRIKLYFKFGVKLLFRKMELLLNLKG